jgi:hypothetical protein
MSENSFDLGLSTPKEAPKATIFSPHQVFQRRNSMSELSVALPEDNDNASLFLG